MNKREWMLHAALTVPQWVEDSTNEHVVRLGALYDAICAATPTVADEGWVEHDGDVNKAPVEGRQVQVTFRDGAVHTDDSGLLHWDHDGQYEDIVRWRYV